MDSKRIVKTVIFILIAAMIIASFLYVVKDKDKKPSYPNSSELIKSETTVDGVTHVDYLDVSGNPCFAGDKGYASYVRYCYSDGKWKREEYRDQYGALTLNNSNFAYVEISYENNVTIYRYFDVSGNPAVITSGYSVLVRTKLNDNGDVIDMYYDSDMNQIKNNIGCYGVLRKYDDGRNYESTYLDINGNPTICNGYATVIRTFYEDKKIETETYFDVDGSRIALPGGNYGVHYEYNNEGQKIRVTYLGVDGAPCLVTSGYSSIVYIYNEKGQTETERYFDLNGNPCKSGKYRYGIKHVDGKDYYLDKDGNVVFTIDSVFKNYPYVVMIAGVILCVLFMLLPRKFNIVLLVLYFMFIIYQTLLLREQISPEPHFVLFRSYQSFLSDSFKRTEIINNIWLFIPFGVGVKAVINRKLFVYLLFLLPILIESIQLMFGIGTFEMDDIFNNCLGYTIGLLLYYAFGKDKTND